MAPGTPWLTTVTRGLETCTAARVPTKAKSCKPPGSCPRGSPSPECRRPWAPHKPTGGGAAVSPVVALTRSSSVCRLVHCT